MKEFKTSVPIEFISEFSTIEKVFNNELNSPIHADCLENMVKNFKKRWYKLSINHSYERVIRELADTSYSFFMDKVKMLRELSEDMVAIEDYNTAPLMFPETNKQQIFSWNDLSNTFSKLKVLVSR